jgi:predicted nuclease of predicted toxin-antitoxin system
MRFLLDKGMPRTAAELLRRIGHDAVHVADVGMADAADGDILERARLDARVVVTLDADFHALLAATNSSLPSVIRVRIEGLRAEPLADLILDVVSRCGTELDAGAVVTVEPHRLRLRRLPLGGIK